MQENILEEEDSLNKHSFTDLSEELIIPSDAGR